MSLNAFVIPQQAEQITVKTIKKRLTLRKDWKIAKKFLLVFIIIYLIFTKTGSQ